MKITNNSHLKYIPSATSTMLVALGLLSLSTAYSSGTETKFKPIPTQFIAALVDPQSKSGDGAQTWGLWEQDPGPRGVWLSLFNVLKAAGGYAPALWQFDPKDWWLDENGLIMEKPKFALAPGKYQVTGNRDTTAILTIYPKQDDGNQKWQLSDNATIHDVTHLGCRSSRFTPISSATNCTPANAPKPAFPISIGTKMPNVAGCNKQDYSVLFVVAKAVEDDEG